ncbi:MAG: signal recognition particle-docking protein FtsY [Nitrospiraceae bacterium]|nr:signal recognition particle-docking protein FtsY [Nitrospiraceae bacterium]
MAIFEKLKNGLTRTKKGLIEKIESVFTRGKISREELEELEEILVSADVGIHAAQEITASLRETLLKDENAKEQPLMKFLKNKMSSLLGSASTIQLSGEKPFVIIVAGVNGTGKTTTIGKLAHRFISNNISVMLAASDTFRAAAIEQLEIWAERTGASIVKHQSGADPAAVAFDAIESAKHKKIDVVIIDTAGRLHTKSPLMEELKKIKRVSGKAMPGAPHEVLLVVDATTGQNALRQAELFNKEIGITGVILTKLDGTAKGGIVFAIKKDLGIPVKMIGIGEGMDDLHNFNPEEFVEALFS